MPDEEQYARQLDAEAVARARKTWPAPGTVRRVRIDDRDTSHQMAQAANADREREGATENE